MSDLDQQLEKIASVPILLVASDYDGTIAPIVSDPRKASPHREAVIAVRNLVNLSQTYVAIISGRALTDLANLMRPPEEVHLVGSHGSEFDLNFATSLSPEALKLHSHIRTELSEIASRGTGLTVEHKPASVALHYRNASEADTENAIQAVMKGPAAIEGVTTKHGKKVVELGVTSTNKGHALEKIRHFVGASAVIFFGDDVTDEDAFATLTGPDIAVKVGHGETRATYRVDGPEDVTKVLARLSELRAGWLTGAKAVPIEQHAMLSDQRTIALATPTANITWFCVPRIDSPALFAELLGGPSAGYFSISSADDSKPIEQQYVPHSLVLRTRWPNFTVTDFLDCSGGRPLQRAGRSDLIRIIEGTGKATIEFAPRLDFGRASTKLVQRNGGLEIQGTLDPIVLRSPGIDWVLMEEGNHHTARAEVELQDKPLILELCYGTGSMRNTNAAAIDRRLLTEIFWSSWAEQLTVPGVASNLVMHSAIVLRGLCFGPSGAISAAGTTSLPEHIGGVRNWDYRYCWLRDAAMSAASLVKLGSTTEAMHFLDWVLDVVDNNCGSESPERLQPLYTITGVSLGAEAEIAELSGYCGSRPVRVGNAASRQVQLDVFGPIVELVAQLVERDAPLSSQHWRLVEAMVHAVERRWHEPDHGIWEIRRPPRHHVHSKVMCWLTVDRAITITNRFLDRQRKDWMALRDRIAADVIEHGFKSQANAFTAAYDDTDIDAAALYIGLSGLLPPSDPRFLGTIEAVERTLLNGPTVYRYRSDDGLPGFEGGFHICASWLVEAYLLADRRDDARKLFNGIVKLAGQTGAFSEQYTPKKKLALGNVPQAYSHIGIIENAIRLANLK